MRLFFHLVPFFVLLAGTAGCGSKAPADSNAPPGVSKNPNCPNPDAINRRKLMLIDPHKGHGPSEIKGRR